MAIDAADAAASAVGSISISWVVFVVVSCWTISIGLMKIGHAEDNDHRWKVFHSSVVIVLGNNSSYNYREDHSDLI